MRQEEVLIEGLDTKQRVSDIGHELLESIPSKSMLKKLIKKKAININGQVAHSGDFVQNGDLLSVQHRERVKPKPHFSFEIAYEDDFLAVVIKPFGIPVSGNKLNQLDNALPYYLSPSPQNDSLLNPQPIHRLDSQTYGLVIVAKTYSVLRLLNADLSSGQISKYYEAIVQGNVDCEMVLETPIGGKSSKSICHPIAVFPSSRFEFITHVSLQAVTGRTHQLRIHMSTAGFPIMGDRLYCPTTDLIKGKGLYLAALKVKFKHPITKKELLIEVAAPKKFLKILKNSLLNL